MTTKFIKSALCVCAALTLIPEIVLHADSALPSNIYWQVDAVTADVGSSFSYASPEFAKMHPEFSGHVISDIAPGLSYIGLRIANSDQGSFKTCVFDVVFDQGNGGDIFLEKMSHEIKPRSEVALNEGLFDMSGIKGWEREFATSRLSIASERTGGSTSVYAVKFLTNEATDGAAVSIQVPCSTIGVKLAMMEGGQPAFFIKADKNEAGTKVSEIKSGITIHGIQREKLIFKLPAELMRLGWPHIDKIKI